MARRKSKRLLLILMGVVIMLSGVTPFLSMLYVSNNYFSRATSATVIQIGYRTSGVEASARARALQAGNRYVLLHPNCGDIEDTYECWQLECARNEFHKDTIQCTQALIRQQAEIGNLDSDYLIIINGDIYLGPDFGRNVDNALGALLKNREQPQDGYFLVGNRSNYKCDINSVPYEFAGTQGKYAFDYFIVPKKFFLSFHLPPYVLGVWRWDNALVNRFLKAKGIMTVDVSQVVQCMHCQADYNEAHHNKRAAAPRNHQLTLAVSQSEYRIGSFDAIQYIMDKNFKLSLNHKYEARVIMPIVRAANENQIVIMMFVNDHNLLGILNFLCWSNRLGITNVVLVATEGARLSKYKFPSHYSITLLNAHGFENIKETTADSSSEIRQRVLADALGNGVSIILADPATVWLDDVHRLVTNEHDVIVTENDVLFLRSTKENHRHIRSEAACWKNPTSLECWDIETKSDVPKHNVLSSSSNVKWDKQNLHLPSIFRFSGIRDAKRRHVWALDDQFECMAAPLNPSKSLSDSASLHQKLYDKADVNQVHYSDLRPTVLRVNIITQYRISYLKRCLTHLEQALGASLRLGHFELEIDLHVIVNNHLQDPEMVKGNQEVHEFLNAHVWPFGTMEVKQIAFPDLLDVWTSVEPLEDTDSMILVLEDDIFVSQYIFEYISAAHHKYVVHEQDSNLVGFSTHYQEYTWCRTLKEYKSLQDFVVDPLYKYQMPNTWAPVYFSDTWREFREWSKVVPHKPDYSPCIYHCHSNQWFLEKPSSVWSVHMFKFLHEKSYYMLHYTDSGRKGLSAHMKAPGLHFKTDEKPTNPLFVSYTEVFKIITYVASTSLDDMRLLNAYSVEFPDVWTLQMFEKIRKSYPSPSNLCDPGYKPKPTKGRT